MGPAQQNGKEKIFVICTFSHPLSGWPFVPATLESVLFATHYPMCFLFLFHFLLLTWQQPFQQTIPFPIKDIPIQDLHLNKTALHVNGKEIYTVILDHFSLTLYIVSNYSLVMDAKGHNSKVVPHILFSSSLILSDGPIIFGNIVKTILEVANEWMTFKSSAFIHNSYSIWEE